jgi:hypothetical protein
MKETQLQTKVTKWLKDNWRSGSCGGEIKISKGGSIPFSSIPDHQLVALRKAVDPKDVLVFKPPDNAVGYKPFDFFVLHDAMAYFVFGFYGGKDVYLIEAYEVYDEIWDSKKKKRRSGAFSIGWADGVGEKIAI